MRAIDVDFACGMLGHALCGWHRVSAERLGPAAKARPPNDILRKISNKSAASLRGLYAHVLKERSQ